MLRNANLDQLEKAVADNHAQLFGLNAISHGGESISRAGLNWTCGGPNLEAMVPFPNLEEANAGRLLDEMMDYYRAQAPSGIGCWSLDPPHPLDLGLRLMARGFQPGWQPFWMYLDLHNINEDYPKPKELDIIQDNFISLDQESRLPYAGDRGAVSVKLFRNNSGRAYQFVAKLNGHIVGQTAVLFSEGALATAGIYNVGVVPEKRNLGIGKALVSTVCKFAREKGYHYAVLNGTGRRMYEQVGFKWISYGLTWWVVSKKYITDPPTPIQIELAEAIGKGDLESLIRIRDKYGNSLLDQQLTNGMTLVQLAAHFRQKPVASWLIENGYHITVLDAWNMDWKERAAEILRENPQLVNLQYGSHRTTILHVAAEKNDVQLAQLALSAHPDLSITDIIYNGTALGWAYYLESHEVAKLIQEYAENQNSKK